MSYMSLLYQNLLSVLTLTSHHAFRVIIESNTVEFVKDKIPRFYASVGADRVALLSGSTVVQSEVASPAQVSDYELWHRRFCHLSHGRLKSLVEHKSVSDLKLPSVPSQSKIPICPSCLDGKQTRDAFPQSTSRRLHPLELIHSDLHGPLPPTAGAYKYWISFTDDASRYRRCWLLKAKSEAFDAFKQYKAWAEKQTGKSIKALRDDKGGEYMSNQWEKFMQDHGIERQHTTRATPQQNGVAERTNRILDEGITSLLSHANLPARFWGEALSSFLHTLNRSPSAALLGKTPHEAFYNRIPSVSHLRVFGCRAYAHVQKDKRSAFQPKSRKCIFLGYPIDYKGWKCWDPIVGDVFISRDVRFVETEMPGADLGLSGPRYEPMSGSVGELAGKKQAPSTSSNSSPSSVPSVDPVSAHSDDCGSDCASESDSDHFSTPDFVSDSVPVTPHSDFVPETPDRSVSPLDRDVISPVHSESSSGLRTPQPSSDADLEHSPSPEPTPSVSPEPASDSRDSSPPVAGQPYVTRSGRTSRPLQEWWKVDHPYKHARELHRETRRSGSSESTADASIAALEEANSLRTLSDSELIEYAFLTSGSEPQTYKEAMSRDDAGLWHEASQLEYDSMHKHGVWELCELLAGRKAVACCWVFCIKTTRLGL